MKKIAIKRLIYSSNYHTLWEEQLSSAVAIGGEEYDSNLSDYNILGTIREIGKWDWASSYGDCLVRSDGKMYVKVHTFYQYQKSWYNLFWDWIRRII